MSNLPNYLSGEGSDTDETPKKNVTIRPPGERKAMSKMSRRQAEDSHRGQRLWFSRGEEVEDERPQYTMVSRPRENRKRILPWASESTGDYRRDKKRYFLDINNTIHQYLSWSFRTSYFMLFITFALYYFGFVVMFALMYYWTSLYYPMCITSNGQMIGHGEGTRIFADCFQLSWTTFSTVGYGLVFPATAGSSEVPTGCVGLSILSSFQAFTGLIFADFCACVLFGKVLRTQNNAQVFFSNPIVVRFGKKELSESDEHRMTGVAQKVEDETKLECDEELHGMLRTRNQNDQDIPCPSLEFRLVNSLHGVPSGEIVEAKLKCVAILDPNLSKWNKRQQFKDDHALSVVNEKTTIGELAEVLKNTVTRRAKPSINFHSTDSKQPHMFTNISLDADEHPYFQRVWFGRHRLDEHSPLLTPEARNRVKLAGGYWPADMNNYRSIKSSLHFRHILVCISGTSNVSAAQVYAQKVYDLVDVNIGHRFVPMNYHADDGTLKTDSYLLNAIYPQRGGGAEPF